MNPRFSYPRRHQRARLRLAALSVAAVLGACGPDIQVRTAVSPEANLLSGRRTFRIVEAGQYKEAIADNGNGTADDAATGYGIPDPMVDNSITAKAIHDQIKVAFEERGYRYSPDKADFEIRFNATIAPILDVRTYNAGAYGAYGYRGYYGYGYGYDGFCCANDGFGYAVGTFDRNSVIIDAVDPRSKKLLWRGQGTSGTYTDPKRYMKELRHAVRAVVKKFPPSNPPVPVTVMR
jgi:uncharacterized protein DUF4136